MTQWEQSNHNGMWTIMMSAGKADREIVLVILDLQLNIFKKRNFLTRISLHN